MDDTSAECACAAYRDGSKEGELAKSLFKTALRSLKTLGASKEELVKLIEEQYAVTHETQRSL